MPLPQLWTVDQAIGQLRLPGQLAVEAALTRAFLLEHGARYHWIGTNVRLGEGDDPGPAYPEYARRYAIATTQKRADLVGFRDTGVDIFEVKVQANLSEIGQLLGYQVLWNREFPASPADLLGVIAHHLSLDTATALLAQHMPFFLYPDVELPDLTSVEPP